MTAHNLFNIAADICGHTQVSILPVRECVPKHRADRDVDAPSLAPSCGSGRAEVSA